MAFAGEWMKLENIMLSETSQALKVKDQILTPYWQLEQSEEEKVVTLWKQKGLSVELR